ncbi:hypothetical protein [Bacterioplanoides sp.]|uniref:hypothetical protein n=1 Tax=Bacterioplanoides sp. TaxID=2066072 RepID=UPI003B5B969B
MKKIFIPLIATALVTACGGGSSSSSTKDKPAVGGGAGTGDVVTTFKVETSTYDYFAVKTSAGWQNLTNGKDNSIAIKDKQIEIAHLCIDSQNDEHLYTHQSINFDTFKVGSEYRYELHCEFPKNSKKVTISNGTAGFNLIDAEPALANSSETASNDEDIEVIMPKTRSTLDIFAIGKNTASGKFYGHRNKSVTLKDGETYAVDFNDSKSSILATYTPKKSDANSYYANYFSNNFDNGISLNINESDTWVTIPQVLSDNDGSYQEQWIYTGTPKFVLSYIKSSTEPGQQSRITGKTSPLKISDIKLSEADLSVTTPVIPPKFSDLKLTNIVLSVSNLGNNSVYDYTIGQIGGKAGEAINIDKILDFSSLPGFPNTTKRYVPGNNDIKLNVFQYNHLDIQKQSIMEGILYGFDLTPPK